MATVTLISKSSDDLALALKFAEAGHVTRVFNPKLGQAFKGFKNPTMLTSLNPRNHQADLTLVLTEGAGELVSQLTDREQLVSGGGLFFDRLTSDLDYLTQVIGLTGGGRRAQPEDEGIQCSVGGWFLGDRWLDQTLYWAIHKLRMLEDNHGTKTPGMGCVVAWADPCSLTHMVLGALTPLLTKVAYLGPLEASCIIDSGRVHTFGFSSPRPGVISALMELSRLHPFDFLYRTATGTPDDWPKTQDRYGLSVRLSMPPWPYPLNSTWFAGAKVVAVPTEAAKHVWQSDISLVDNEPRAGGIDGSLGFVTARGRDPQECTRRANRTIRNIVQLPDVQYRRDITTGAEEQVAQLTDWGWLNA